jgi:hypothetical protein
MSEIPTVLTPALGAVIGEVRRLEDDALVDELRLVEEQMRWVSARRAAVIAVVQERVEAAGARVHGTADQIAVVLEISPRSADHLLDDAIAVVGRPLVWDAVHDAKIDMGKALLIVTGLAGFDGLPRMDMERDAIGYAQTHTAYQLRKYLIRLTCDGDPGEIFRKEALDRRGVSIFPAGHGMADISARLSLEHAEVFFQRLNVLAKSEDCPDPYGQGDARSLDQRRADALAGFLENTTEISVHVDVAIPADTLIGDDHRDALLGRHGAIPASLARDLAWSPDARWRRLITDPRTGALIDCASEVYKVPDRIKRAVRLRDRTCRFPGCTRPGEYTDTDHIQPWAKDGKTEVVNLAALCRRHHLLKTHSAWTVRHRGDMTNFDMHWTSPLGTSHSTSPHTYHERD